MRAYERLIRYAKVYTTSDDSFDCCPSTERQLDLAKMLAEELKALGISDARVDENGYVTVLGGFGQSAVITATDGVLTATTTVTLAAVSC